MSSAASGPSPRPPGSGSSGASRSSATTRTPGARALASSRSNIIALMVPLRTDMYVPVMMEIAIAVATTARTHGYDVLLLTGEEGPDAVRRVTGSGLADAMILMDVELDDERLPLLREHRPARRADRAARRHHRTDLRRPRLRGDRRAVRRASGRRSATATSPSSARRRRSTSGTPASPSAPWTGSARRAGELGLRRAAPPVRGQVRRRWPCTLARILDERPGTTGFVVQNEAAIEPLLSLLRQQGRAVPEDVSVVAICPDQVAVAGLGAADLGRHPRAGDGPARRGAAGRQAGRATAPTKSCCSRPS